MADEVVTTPEAEVNAPTEETVTEATAVVEEKPIGEIINVPEEKHNLIPESVFLGEKKARKAAEKELKALKESIERGASNDDVSDDIDSMAEEFGVDKGFLKKFAKTVSETTRKSIEEANNAKLSEKDNAQKFEDAFNTTWDKSLERAPEFANIANKDIIKQLALLPQNAKKTLTQIIEDTYGHVVPGKRTVDTVTPGGGKDSEPLDYQKARKDIEYLKEVLANPTLKEKYNALMLQDIK